MRQLKDLVLGIVTLTASTFCLGTLAWAEYNPTETQVARLEALIPELGIAVPGGVVTQVGGTYEPGSAAYFGISDDGIAVWMLEEWELLPTVHSGPGEVQRFRYNRWRFSEDKALRS